MEYQVQLEKKWIVLNRQNNPKTGILCIPGRGNHAAELCRLYSRHLDLNEHLIVGITPLSRCWYPMPNGIGDQYEAVQGQYAGLRTLEWAVKYIEDNFNVSRKNMIMTGHSAGAVMAILMAAHSPEPFAGVISHCGAILDPKRLPLCGCPSTKFLLTHSKDDLIFEWYERYMPMLNTLDENGYDVYTVEEEDGSHGITDRQLEMSKYFVNACFKNTK